MMWTAQTETAGSVLDAPVLVAVVNRPEDLARAAAGWYRIPLNAPARQLAAEYVAFYQTGAFPPPDRWAVHFYAPVRGYHVTTRRELIPAEPEHPRADELYYRVDLGALVLLPRPIPSRRLRRITFIHTTLDRLLSAGKINDLWIKTRGQALLWEALQEAQLEAETEYPLIDDKEQDGEQEPTADCALFCRDGRIAVMVTDEPGVAGALGEQTARREYFLARGGWNPITIRHDELEHAGRGWLERILELVGRLGDLEPPPVATDAC